jgi:hypothetical protein
LLPRCTAVNAGVLTPGQDKAVNAVSKAALLLLLLENISGGL